MEPVAQPQRKMFYRTLPWHQVRSGDLPGEWRYEDGSVVPRTLWPSRERVMAGMVNKPWPPTPNAAPSSRASAATAPPPPVAAPSSRASAATAPPPRPAIVQPPVPYAPPAAVFNQHATRPRSQSTTSMPATTAANPYRLGDVGRSRALPTGVALPNASNSLPTMSSTVRQPTTGVAPLPPSAYGPNTDARDAVASALTAAPPASAATIAPSATSSPATDPRDAMLLSWFSSPPAATRLPVSPPDIGKYQARRTAAIPISPVPAWVTQPTSEQQKGNAHIALANELQGYGKDRVGLAMGLVYGTPHGFPKRRFRPINFDTPQPVEPYKAFEGPLGAVAAWNRKSGLASTVPFELRSLDGLAGAYMGPLGAVAAWARTPGLASTVPVELRSLNGLAGAYSGRDKRIYIDPKFGESALTMTHEMYHADQDQRFGITDYQTSLSDPSVPAPQQQWNMQRLAFSRAATELPPTILDQLLPHHVAAIDTRGVKGYGNADAQMQDILTRGTGRAPDGYFPGPRGFAVPLSTLEQQAARYGAFGPTPRAKGLGYTGTTRRPIEELLTTPEGKAWLRRYMTAGVGE